ncbi:unnamed protein product [Rangifer tarandus platyrhynchus]|uniref:Uncharacterized protein n=1 Tax=Rangifer tarandus platyrhynchus TaxID=3082113 RepID=A0AC59Z1U8_RANTA
MGLEPVQLQLLTFHTPRREFRVESEAPCAPGHAGFSASSSALPSAVRVQIVTSSRGRGRGGAGGGAAAALSEPIPRPPPARPAHRCQSASEARARPPVHAGAP